jgi:hypothetical protein
MAVDQTTAPPKNSVAAAAGFYDTLGNVGEFGLTLL